MASVWLQFKPASSFCALVVAMHANEIDSEYIQSIPSACLKVFQVIHSSCHIAIQCVFDKILCFCLGDRMTTIFSSCLNQFAIERTHTWHMHAYIFTVKIYGINFQFLSELFPSSYPTTQRYSMSLAVQYVCRLDAFITSPKNALECSEQWNIFRRQNVVRWIQQLE